MGFRTMLTPIFSASMLRLYLREDWQRWLIAQMHTNYKKQFHASMYNNHVAALTLQDVANMYLMGGEL